MAGPGACTSMTIRMYAERKKLALTGIHVELNHQKIDIDGIKRDQIKRSITPQGVLSTEEQQRLLEIATCALSTVHFQTLYYRLSALKLTNNPT